MRVNKYDFILKMFVGDDKRRPELMSPGTIDGMAYATDAHAIIRFPADLCLEKYTTGSFPNVQKVYGDFVVESELKCDVVDLLESLYERQFTYERKLVICDVCDGAGEIECRCCDNYSDCKDCDGQGTEMAELPFSKPILEGMSVRFFDYKIQPRYLYATIQAALILGEKKFSVKKFDRGLLLKFGSCEVIIMRML